MEKANLHSVGKQIIYILLKLEKIEKILKTSIQLYLAK